MAEIEWTKDLSVGIELIDEQHKMLIEHLNNLTKSLESNQGAAKISDTLGFLIEYTDFHFSAEEKHMAANGYQELEAHKTMHKGFKETLANLEEDFQEEGATPVLAESIDSLLVDWLLKHIRGVDVKFGAFLESNNITIPKEG